MVAFLKKIITFWRKQYFTGVATDPRFLTEQQRDYLHEERVPPPTPDPFSNERITVSPYPYSNQNKTSSCVPHGVALALGIERELDGDNFVELSPMFLYRQRTNYPEEGSWPVQIFSIARKYGAPLYKTLRTPQTEDEANNVLLTSQMFTEAEIYRGGEYYTLETPTDFRQIAEIAQRGHGVPILVYGLFSEWARTIPILEKVLSLIGAPIRHCVCVLPKSGHWHNGVAYITVQDSSWFGGYKLRHVSEKFIKARCYGAFYWDNVQFIGSGERPKYTFTKVLSFGANSDEVKAVQRLLIAEGLLPNDMDSGYFGGRTLAGIRAFQNKYSADILMPLKLDAPTNTWGSACIAKANKLCAVLSD